MRKSEAELKAEQDADLGSTENLHERQQMVWTLQSQFMWALARELHLITAGSTKQDSARGVEAFYLNATDDRPTDLDLSTLFRDKCCDATVTGQPLRLKIYEELLQTPPRQRMDLLATAMGFAGVVGLAQRIRFWSKWKELCAPSAEGRRKAA